MVEYLVFFVLSQARQVFLSTSTSPTGRWVRWCPTCPDGHRRTEASWRVPKKRESCCGRSWNVDLSLGSFSTDQCTENTEAETERRVCQLLEGFFFSSSRYQTFSLAWWLLLQLSAPTLSLCMSCFIMFCSFSFFFADELHGALLFSPTFNPSKSCYRSLFLFLSATTTNSVPHFCHCAVCRALPSIKWASLLLQKDSLKCQQH